MTTTYDVREPQARPSTARLLVLAGTFAALAGTAVTGSSFTWAIAIGALCLSAFAMGGASLLQWDRLIAALLLVIFFIPIGRYSFPSTLPFELEPYRVYVAALIVFWLVSLLVDPRVRLQRSGLEAPIAALLLVIMLSEVGNLGTISEQNLYPEVAKQLTFFLSFVGVFFALVSLVTTRAAVDRILKVLVGGAAVVAVSAIYEARTGYNVFAHLQQVIPILENLGLSRVEPPRGGLARAYGSAQHPIALGAVLVMLVPLGVYLAVRTGRRRWWFVCALLIVASLATISRTSVLMLIFELIVFAALRPREVKRLWILAPVFLVAIHFAIPGTLGTLKDTFFPKGGLIAEQSAAQVGSGRVVTLGPSLGVWESHPLLGVGYGTRIVVPGPKKNAYILDNQWLGTLLELGLAGILVWLWIFLTFVNRMLHAARERSSDDPDSWLFAALAASVGSFGVGMFFYDAFSFTQVTIVAFVLLAVGAAALRIVRRQPRSVLQVAGEPG